MNLISLSKRESEETGLFRVHLLSESQACHCPLGIQVTRKESLKDKNIMGLIEIVGVCKTNSRTNGFSEHNEEKAISYSLFSCHNGNDLLEMEEQIIDRCTQTQNSQRCFDASRLVTHREYLCLKFFVVDFAGYVPRHQLGLWPSPHYI